MSDLVTIIIPVYNGQEWLNKCLDSVINQTYKNLEIIVVNDGSFDDSQKIIDEYKNKDSRIVSLIKENGGLSSARNYGLKVFKGDYVYFLDCDDYLYETSIEYLLSILKKYDVDIVYSFTNRRNANPMILDSDIEIKNQDEAILSYLRGENFSESVCAKLFKHYFFEKLRFEEGRIHEDTFITYQILDMTNSIAISKFNGYISAIRDESITHSTFGNKNYDKVIASHNIYDFYNGTKYETLAYNKYIGCLLYFILNTNKLDNVSLNKVALDEFKELIKKNGIKNLGVRFIPFVLASKLNLLRKLGWPE